MKNVMKARKYNSEGTKIITSLEVDTRILRIYRDSNIAIFFSNIRFWCKKNEADRSEFHRHEDDKGVVRYWTYNTVQSFSELFPFWTSKQIRKFVNNLKEDGFLLIGNFNKANFDRTIWYAIDEDTVDKYKVSKLTTK